MKRLRSIAFVGFAIVSPVLAGPWQPWGPNGGDTSVIATHPRIAEQALTARIDGNSHVDKRVQTFGTQDFGTSWPLRGRFDVLEQDSLLTLAIGGTPEYRYLAASGKVYRSQDGGIAWTPVGYEAFVGEPIVLGAHPDNGAEVVLQLGGSLFHSTNAGTTLGTILTPGPATSGAIDWSTRRAYLVMQDNWRTVVAKALDSGNVWLSGPPLAIAVAANFGHVIASTQGGLWHSSDGGAGWQAVPGVASGFVAAAVAYAHQGTPIAYAVERSGTGRVLRSVDGGASWAFTGSLPAAATDATIAVQAGNADTLLVGTGAGIYRSLDAGATWSLLPRSGDLPAGTVRAVVFDATNPSRRWLWRDADHAEEFADRTQDGGTTWTSGAFAGEIFASDPSLSGHVFAVGLTEPPQPRRSAVFRSIDGGASFTAGAQKVVEGGVPVAIVKGNLANELHFFGAPVQNLLTSLAWTMRSTDGGATWTETAAPPGNVLSAAAASNGALYAGIQLNSASNGLYRSLNDGATWLSVPMGEFSGPVTALAVAPSNANRIYAALAGFGGGGRHLATSGDGGATWTSAWTAMPSTVVNAIAVDPLDPAKVYVATHGQGVFRSADAGATWAALDVGLADKRVRGLAFDPFDATKLYASTESGPFVADLATGVPAGYRRAIEYYHQAFEHYFISADADELAGLDAGVFEGWGRTREAFAVAEAGQPGQSAVCRFFGVGFAPKSSHFYTPYPTECEIVKADPMWFYERIAFGLRLPEVNGGCAIGTIPLYRLWNRNAGSENTPNHRYTTSLVEFFQMYPSWMYEGDASTFVFACVPE